MEPSTWATLVLKYGNIIGDERNRDGAEGGCNCLKLADVGHEVGVAWVELDMVGTAAMAAPSRPEEFQEFLLEQRHTPHSGQVDVGPGPLSRIRLPTLPC
jgi:hypothetical protein